MKKIFCIIMMFMFTLTVHASSYRVSLEGDDTFSDTIILRLRINSLTNFDNGIYGLSGRISYDKETLELIDSYSIDNFDLRFDHTISNKFVLYSDTDVYSGTDILFLEFKNISLEDNESTTINVTEILASDGENDIEGNSISKTITYKKPAYMKGDLNKNGKIDLKDIIILIKKYLGTIDSSNEDIVIGDMNSNNKIDLKDIILLIKTYLQV